MKKITLKHLIWLVIGALMAVQIVYGFAWMVQNIAGFPPFGDSTEYYNLSQTLIVDEYRPILYPLLVRMADEIAGCLPGVEYQTLLYIVQALVSLLSIYYFVRTIAGALYKGQLTAGRYAGIVYFTLYLFCIPMITLFNFTVLTDSLATSMMLFMLASVTRIFKNDCVSWKDFLLIALSMLVEYLIRADRLYTCTLFLVICFAVYLVKRRSRAEIKRAAVCMLCCILLSTCLASAINKKTQQPGVYGRISTSFAFILLDRVVWPHMAANYESFPDEIKEIVSFEDAVAFDSHNNNVMYQMAPLIVEQVGEEKAEELYLEMAAIVFDTQTKLVLFEIMEDITCMLFTPVTACLARHMTISTSYSWNLYCAKTITPKLAQSWYAYYVHSFLVMFILAGLYTLYSLIRKKSFGDVAKKLGPGFALCLIITLWFSIGDGAPPNDRYALLHYIIWTFWAAGTLLYESAAWNVSFHSVSHEANLPE
ncbi:MAG: hypothetical protein LUI87_08580 [Lachnospiraceae bacterium]|nr:hypothetical protein [Lachnospiraceae bacterium]